MPVYECEICGERMVGYASLSLTESYPEDYPLYTVAACWDCRHAIEQISNYEHLLQPLFIDFVKRAKEKLAKFKEQVT